MDPPTCGAVITNSVILSTASDGAETLKVDPNVSDLEATESPLASKDVIVLVTHGICGVNGASTTKIKLGLDSEKLTTGACAEVHANIFTKCLKMADGAMPTRTHNEVAIN